MRITGHYEITKRAIQKAMRANPHDILVQDFRINPTYEAPAKGSRVDDIQLTARVVPPLRAPLLAHNAALIGASSCNIPLTSEPFGFLESVCDDAENPADGSVCRDLQDVINLNHCRDTPDAQAAHFMRASNQTTKEAHHTACKYIWSNTQQAAELMHAAMAEKIPHYLQAMKHAPRQLFPEWPPRQRGLFTAGLASKHLDRAVHSLQDSFAPFHVERADKQPTGNIQEIKCYIGQDHKQHDEQDKAWIDANGFTRIGEIAINATKDLIMLAVNLAHSPQCSLDWTKFKNKWLRLEEVSWLQRVLGGDMGSQ